MISLKSVYICAYVFAYASTLYIHSHLIGRTPLHCAASCNDRKMCEFLVRNGAAVMAVTDSDGATASQKCDPYAPGFEECEGFLRGEDGVMRKKP